MLTNEEWLSSLSTEQKARWLTVVEQRAIENAEKNNGVDIYQDWIEWLNEEVATR